MKSFGKWFGGLLVVSFLLFSMSIGTADASSTTKVSSFYKEKTNTKCEYECHSFLMTTPNGNVYQIFDPEGKVTSINSKGKKLWSYTLPKDSSFVRGGEYTTYDSKGNIYLSYSINGFNSGSKSGNYVASINSKGKVNWTFKIDSYGGAGKPYIANDGTVYFGTGNQTDYAGPFGKSSFYALSSKGKKKWKLNLKGDGIFSDIYLDRNKNLVIPTTDDMEIWKYIISTKGKIVSSKTVNSFTFFHDKAWNEYSIDLNKHTLIATNKSGKKLWSYQSKGDDPSIKYVDEKGTVYVSENGNMLSVSKGKIKWKTKVDGEVLIGTKGMYVIKTDVNWDTKKGKTYLKFLDMQTGKIKYSKTTDYYSFNYAIHPQGFVLTSKLKNIYKISLIPGDTPSLKGTQVKITNNKSKGDQITVSKIKKGDVIKVYSKSSKGKLLVSKKSSGTTLTISIKQLGKKSGKVYITNTRSGMLESKRLSVSYKAEKR